MQLEYVQLCKTLYTLLQDSAEEQDLLQAMGRVANSLLKIGEENVTNIEATGQTPHEVPVSVEVSMQNAEDSKEHDKYYVQRAKDASQTESLLADSDQRVTDAEKDVVKNDTSRSRICSNGTSQVSLQSPQKNCNTFDIAVADAAELEAKWFLSFEQFIAGVQQEPELCQFFAEQNYIDLSGTSVDPVLNLYTRTILAKT